MLRAFAAVIAVAAAPLAAAGATTLQALLASGRRAVVLPAGVTQVSSELAVPAGVAVVGHRAGSVLLAANDFTGRAMLVCTGAGTSLSGFTIDGNREALARPVGIAPDDRTFASFYVSNGILAERATGLRIRAVTLRRIAGFAVLVTASRDVQLERLRVLDSGSLNARGRNNTTGGVLFEEGSADFSVRASVFRNVRGNGVWTHSLYTSPRNARGVIAGNRFDRIGRDAIQAGHATEIRVERNRGARIGYPVEIVDVEGRGTPVAIDTAGDVDKSVYTMNVFEEVNGKCIDLDGFHDGEVSGNVCRNASPADDVFGHYGIVFNNTNPDMESRNIRVAGNVIDGAKFGGVFVIGRGHTIVRNRFVRLNAARCAKAEGGCLYDPSQPDLLLSGIYFGARAERPDAAAGNVATGNVVSGFGMRARCIGAAPGVDLKAQTLKGNDCRDAGTGESGGRKHP